ncbi:MAG: hypothetical protein ACRDB0_01620 [Paraclostridium sp.]
MIITPKLDNKFGKKSTIKASLIIKSLGSISSSLLGSILVTSIIGWKLALEIFVITVIIALVFWMLYSKTVKETEKVKEIEAENQTFVSIKIKVGLVNTTIYGCTIMDSIQIDIRVELTL